MTITEGVTWFGIGLVVSAYLYQARARLPKPTAVMLSAQSEVDPTRWRHDGSQQVSFKDGNKSLNESPFDLERELLSSLVF